MSHPDDYLDEMERLSSQEAEEILSGGRPNTAAARGAVAVVERLRADLLTLSPPGAEERHLSAMRAAADESRRDPIMRRGTRKKRAASLALAAALVLGASLAGALTLPEQASETAKQRIEELQPPVGPGDGGQDQVSSEDASDHGKAVSAAAHDDSTKGCEHGRAVSGVASSKAADNRSNEGGPGACGPNEGNNGNHGQGNNGNHGQGNNGNHGQGNNGNHGLANNGKQNVTTDTEPTDTGGNAKNELPHGVETAPGQAKTETTTDPTTSETAEVPEALPTGT